MPAACMPPAKKLQNRFDLSAIVWNPLTTVVSTVYARHNLLAQCAVCTLIACSRS